MWTEMTWVLFVRERTPSGSSVNGNHAREAHTSVMNRFVRNGNRLGRSAYQVWPTGVNPAGLYRPIFVDLEIERPAVDPPGVDGGGVADPEVPGAVGRLGGQVHGERLVDVVRAAALAIEQVERLAVRSHQVDDQVTTEGVHDVHLDRAGGRRVAGAAGDRDRAAHRRQVRNGHIVGVGRRGAVVRRGGGGGTR